MMMKAKTALRISNGAKVLSAVAGIGIILTAMQNDGKAMGASNQAEFPKPTVTLPSVPFGAEPREHHPRHDYTCESPKHDEGRDQGRLSPKMGYRQAGCDTVSIPDVSNPAETVEIVPASPVVTVEQPVKTESSEESEHGNPGNTRDVGNAGEDPNGRGTMDNDNAGGNGNGEHGNQGENGNKP